MKIIKGKEGVPIGTWWINIWSVFFSHPISIKLNHNGIDIVIVKVICLELVKIYGNNPIKLINIIIMNKLKKNNKKIFFF